MAPFSSFLLSVQPISGVNQVAVVLFPLEVRRVEIEDLRSRPVGLELNHCPAVGKLADVIVLVLHLALLLLLAAASPLETGNGKWK